MRADLAGVLEIYQEKFSGRTPAQWWVFRGQESSSWGLKTYLERLLERYKPYRVPDVSPYDVEAKLVRGFQRKAYQYVSDLPNQDDTLEWLSLMRHLGGPTRLLDWRFW
jgi:hypothetical protein